MEKIDIICMKKITKTKEIQKEIIVMIELLY